MGRLIQIRDVPETAHRRLKARAASEGRTLSGYLRRILTETASRPTPEEVLERVRRRPLIDAEGEPAALVRERRETSER